MKRFQKDLKFFYKIDITSTEIGDLISLFWAQNPDFKT